MSSNPPKTITVQANGLLKPCCADESNLGKLQQLNEEVRFRRCKVCGCRHFEANAEPGRLFTRGYEIAG